MLQFLGQPAIAEGNTILLDDYVLEVAQACSGLRMFMAIVALAYVYMVFVKRPWWQKTLLFISLIPIAIIANALRIVLTGLLYRLVSGEAAKAFSHDFAGWVMIPMAALFFGAMLLYLDRLFVEIIPLAQRDMLERKRVR
jgi:exosortase